MILIRRMVQSRRKTSGPMGGSQGRMSHPRIARGTARAISALSPYGAGQRRLSVYRRLLDDIPRHQMPDFDASDELMRLNLDFL